MATTTTPILPSSSNNNTSSINNTSNINNITDTNDPSRRSEQLSAIERRLKSQVDGDLFQDPKSFRTIHRVIDVLGAELLNADNQNGTSNIGLLLGNNISTGGGLGSGGGGEDYKTNFDNLHKNNPAYLSLKRQQKVVDDAIEHLAIHHCSDLNASVVAVGKVSKQFGDAVGHVRGLRAQVQEIRENLANASGEGEDVAALTSSFNRRVSGGAGAGAGAGGNSTLPYLSHHRLGGKSLRELWLKKLECEAVLNLLSKLEIIREAPGAFDALVLTQPCRIGAAVVLLSEALNTMFQDDVAQIQALHKIMEQLMSRKQRAEEILWQTLQDVLYLRTANESFVEKKEGTTTGTTTATNNTASNTTSEKNSLGYTSETGSMSKRGSRGSLKGSRKNRFNASSKKLSSRTAYVSDSDDSNTDDDDASHSFGYGGEEYSGKSGGSGSLDKKDLNSTSTMGGKNVSSAATLESSVLPKNSLAYASYHGHQGRLLPRAMIESELDLEVDEMRCLDNWTSSTTNNPYDALPSFGNNDGTFSLPRYTDSVLALRILIESLAKLGRLDDVERCLSENIELELKSLAQMEQAKTLGKLERMRNSGELQQSHRRAASLANSVSGSILDQEEKLRIFRFHLKSLTSSFGNVMLRLNQLAQILRHRIASDPKISTPSYSSPSSAIHSVLVAAQVTMQREIKGFLSACLNESEDTTSALFQGDHRIVTPSMMDAGLPINPARPMTAGSRGLSSHEQGIFSLGIVSDSTLSSASSMRERYAQNLSLASRSTAMRMTAEEFVNQVLCPRTGTVPQVRHALLFRKNLAGWDQEYAELKKELALVTKEDTTSPTYNATTEVSALDYLDGIVKKTLLPVLQDTAVQGTVSALERSDAFEPIISASLYSSSRKNKQSKVEMCAACSGLYTSTGPLFLALPRLPRSSETYTPVVAHLEHAILTFISRVKQRVLQLCDGKKAFRLLEEAGSKRPTLLSNDMEMKKPFSLLLYSYFDDHFDYGDNVDTPSVAERETDVANAGGGSAPINPLAPSASDTRSKITPNTDEERAAYQRSLLDGTTDLQREQETFEQEVSHLSELLDFADVKHGSDFKLCTEDEFLKTVSLAHSLLSLSSLLGKRLRPKKNSWGKSKSDAPRALRESVKNIRLHGIRVAKFCRMEVLLQTVKRMNVLFKSSSLTSKDAVRIPTCVNDLGEYLTSTSELVRQYGGNKIAAFVFSSLEQYVPLFIMQTVRIVVVGDGLPSKFKITLNGVESLDKTCSVLYRDLKGATSFNNSSWDEDVAADAFERAASYVALMELDMEELVSYCRNNRNLFTEEDYKIMFLMNGPRRRGDISRLEDR